MFEAQGSESTRTSTEAIWARWIEPGRWHEWDPRVTSAEADGELEVGSEVRVKLHKGGTVRQNVVALEPERRLVTEYRLPGARVGHEHLVEPAGSGATVTHRVYVEGPLSGFWAMMLGRNNLREAAGAS